MTRRRKSDADEILAFVEELEAEPWLGRQRASWPSTIYHYTDVRNAAQILGDGRLLSRRRCVEDGIKFVSAGHSGIVEQSANTHGFVRLYFRPRTPTQYWCEGHQPRDKQGPAHCPVPVFFLFDSRCLLTAEECEYTNGNFASLYSERGSTAAFLQDLNFKLIYHTTSFRPEDRDEVIFSRNAEVLFPEELELDGLREIVCRTGAERETLMSILPTTADPWRARIRQERQGERLFERRWAYIRDVQLVEDRVVVNLKRRSEPYDFEVTLTQPETGEVLVHRAHEMVLPPHVAIQLPRPAEAVGVNIRLAGNLAYEGTVVRKGVFES
ncbi:DUF4433 domain-containing protein [Candidatus Palauibacter sp.]|uniref:DUF4433 domain-containing protein n=1 Tax=Candidatus Palauibacter sp. TaxID=3101350 RepID=UPI003C702685